MCVLNSAVKTEYSLQYIERSILAAFSVDLRQFDSASTDEFRPLKQGSLVSLGNVSRVAVAVQEARGLGGSRLNKPRALGKCRRASRGRRRTTPSAHSRRSRRSSTTQPFGWSAERRWRSGSFELRSSPSGTTTKTTEMSSRAWSPVQKPHRSHQMVE